MNRTEQTTTRYANAIHLGPTIHMAALHDAYHEDSEVPNLVEEALGLMGAYPSCASYLIALAIARESDKIRTWADEIKGDVDPENGWPRSLCRDVADSLRGIANEIDGDDASASIIDNASRVRALLRNLAAIR